MEKYRVEIEIKIEKPVTLEKKKKRRRNGKEEREKKKKATHKTMGGSCPSTNLTMLSGRLV